MVHLFVFSFYIFISSRRARFFFPENEANTQFWLIYLITSLIIMIHLFVFFILYLYLFTTRTFFFFPRTQQIHNSGSYISHHISNHHDTSLCFFILYLNLFTTRTFFFFFENAANTQFWLIYLITSLIIMIHLFVFSFLYLYLFTTRTFFFFFRERSKIHNSGSYILSHL
jgi:heme/copper-type cytochrome/quinol oxidase subunit 2